MTDVNRPAWVLWQIRALWRFVLDVEGKLVEILRRVEALEQHDPDRTNDAQEG